MKKIILIILALIPLFAISQIEYIEFKYDDAGNRYLRHVIELPPENRSLENNTETTDSTTVKYIDIIGESDVVIYPNPNGGRFRIVFRNMPDGKTATANLHSISGTMILQQKDITDALEIDIRNRENGTYILSIEIDGEMKTWKVIKQ